MEIKIFKLVSGEVVMGRVSEETEEITTIQKPMVLMLDPMQGGVGMMPYDAVYTQTEIEEQTFEKKHIMHEIQVHPSFEEAYIKQTSGIEIAA